MSRRSRCLPLAPLLLWGALCGPVAAQPDPPLADNPLEGRSLFEAKHCLECHGIAGEVGRIGPTLDEARFAGTFLELGAALWNHVPGMSVTMETAGLPWPDMTPQESEKLLIFLYAIEYLGQPGVAAAGEELFRTKGCLACHSIGGGDEIGPDLSRLTRFASPLSIAQQIWNHGPSMLESIRSMGMSPPSFDDGDLADLSAFIRQRAAPGPRDRLLLSPGSPARGQGVFVEKGCSRCHGDDGDGGDVGPSLKRADLHRSAEAIAGNMWNHSLEMGDVMRQAGVGWPVFEGSELADLIAYLYFLPFGDGPGDAERGGRVFAERSCGDCHAPEVSAEVPAAPAPPDLAAALVGQSSAAFVSALWNHADVMREVILQEGRPWPELSGAELRDLRAYIEAQTEPD